MKITKYEHACLVVEEQGQRLIVDPGSLTRDMGEISGVVGVVFTHEHFDHFAEAQVASIAAHNPGVRFFGTEEVAAVAKANAVTAAHRSETHNVRAFKLTFYGEKHALVTDNKPDNQNVGVLINDTLYYPGDSFETPGDVHPKALALPIGGPWLKVGEAIDLLKRIQPKLAFPTHDALYSEVGQRVAENWLPEACEAIGAKWQSLKPGDSLEV